MERVVGLVQDDEVVRRRHAEYLRASGYRVRTFHERATAAEAFAKAPPDVALLDLTLGAERDGGLRLCSEIRALWPQLPVAFLTARTSEEDQILGLRVGADDHIPSDTSPRLLSVRLEALLRRHDSLRRREEQHVITVGALRVDARWFEVFWSDERVELSLTHYRMVEVLAVAAPEPKTPDELMRASNTHVARNTVAAHVRSIRLRFRQVDPTFDSIRTERGHGYRWAP